MAKNRIYEHGRKLYLTVGAGISSGDPVLVGTMTGVALTDADSDNKATVDFGGVYDLSVQAVDDSGNSAIAVGDHIYYVAADTPKLSKKVSGYFFGYALEAVDAGETDTIYVKSIDGPGPGTADILAGAIGTAELASGAVTAAKLATDAVETAKIKDDAVTKDKIAANVAGSGLAQNEDGSLEVAVDDSTLEIATDTVQVKNSGITTAKLSDAAVTKAKAKVFFSTEQTGTGSAQNIEHGLGAIPAGVIVVPTDGGTVVEGEHTDTYVIVTCTDTKKYKVFAWA